MRSHLIVVEGAHDAAVFGKLLRRLNYSSVQRLADVPPFWEPLIPTKYPVDPGGRLDRIIVFPDIYISADELTTVALSVAGSDTNLFPTLRAAIEIKKVADFATLTVVADTDFAVTEEVRFQSLVQRLITLNAEAAAEGQQGFPLSIPPKAGQLSGGSPKVGIHLWPGNGQQGTLEEVLLECAQAAYPVLRAEADAYGIQVNAKHPPGAPQIAAFRTQSGQLKSICGSIATVLKPGASLAVSIRQSEWLPAAGAYPPSLQLASDYLDALLAVT